MKNLRKIHLFLSIVFYWAIAFGDYARLNHFIFSYLKEIGGGSENELRIIWYWVGSWVGITFLYWLFGVLDKINLLKNVFFSLSANNITVEQNNTLSEKSESKTQNFAEYRWAFLILLIVYLAIFLFFSIFKSFFYV